MPRATLLTGLASSARIDAETGALVRRGRELGGAPPHVVALAVDPARPTTAYLEMLRKKGAELEIGFSVETLAAADGREALAGRIRELDADPMTSGILLQVPLPDGFDANALRALIAPEKDIEGVTPANLGALALGRPRLAPCTALAAMDLVRESGLPLRGLEVVVVGASTIVGKPVALLCIAEEATVTVCHIATRSLEEYTRRADVVISATGVAHLIRSHHVKPGAAVIDVGYARIPDPAAAGSDGKTRYRVVGDVHTEEVAEVAGWVSPVPGGVGPVTVSHLFRNAAAAALPAGVEAPGPTTL